eukprot:COSAG01_NODE_26651_length_707_cov_0.902961_1_plen_159_part_01
MRVRQLLSHSSGMPDMVPRNLQLRRRHAPLSEFVADAMSAPLLFAPGTGFSYQSAGILLVAEIVERISGQPLRELLDAEIFQPLGMSRSALGLGDFVIEDTVRLSGVGSTAAKTHKEESDFGGNSRYWRDQAHPWGGMHSSAPDLAILMRCMLLDAEAP